MMRPDAKVEKVYLYPKPMGLALTPALNRGWFGLPEDSARAMAEHLLHIMLWSLPGLLV
ncbi:hypothetical protein ACYZT7_20580 [Pseudomonas sp. RT4P38]